MKFEKDIYFQEKYGALYEKAEKGSSVCWHYTGPEGEIIHNFLLREIPQDIFTHSVYDLITPYGYGGPLITRLSRGYTRHDLVTAFSNAFSQYCKEKRIVCEFIRFHPIAQNANDFTSIYHGQVIRNTLGTDLTREDPFAEEFSKGCRKNIRRAIANGVSWKITFQPDNIKSFQEIYYDTMDRNSASEFYYFDDTYFLQCIENFKENLLLVEAIYQEKTIAAGLYFVSDGIIHIHLSGTRSEYLHLSPAYILRYAAMQWGLDHGCRLIHHGGGRTNSEEDSLFCFKKQFAQKTQFPFSVGKKIWDMTAYQALCEYMGADMTGEFFPAYRKQL